MCQIKAPFLLEANKQSANRVERPWHYQCTVYGNAHGELLEIAFS